MSLLFPLQRPRRPLASLQIFANSPSEVRNSEDVSDLLRRNVFPFSTRDALAGAQYYSTHTLPGSHFPRLDRLERQPRVKKKHRAVCPHLKQTLHETQGPLPVHPSLKLQLLSPARPKLSMPLPTRFVQRLCADGETAVNILTDRPHAPVRSRV